MKELCFIIETKEIYLEEVLVEYMDVPVFFLCKDSDDYYVSLCTDMEELNYIVVPASVDDIYRLLNGKNSMRNVILDQSEYWKVYSGSEIIDDKVYKCKMDEIDKDVLPDEDACFEILTAEHRKYTEQFNENYLKSGWNCFPCEVNIDANEILYSGFEHLEQYRNLFNQICYRIKLNEVIQNIHVDEMDACKEIPISKKVDISISLKVNSSGDGTEDRYLMDWDITRKNDMEFAA
ncbi:MAG: hypothetical protein K2K70_02000 [Lachnospiraceae bacterium]|nr:hypothetical protein [Lachnospiraceae bacterium]